MTGATGALGGMVVEQLLARVPADQVVASVRDPRKAAGLADRGVQVRQGTYDDLDTLTRAFAGADRVLLVSAPRVGDTLLAAHRTAIEAARSAGVGRVLYTSHVGSDPVSPFPPNRGHAATEAMLRESGVPFTVLRNGFYTATAERQVQEAARTGELRAPADAPVSWTTPIDLAAATATLLLDQDLTDTVVTLTSGQAHDLAQLASLVGEITGRPVERVVLPDADYRAALIAAGTPEFAADMTTGIWLASRQRRFGITDPALGRLLGRPTTPIRTVLERALNREPPPTSR